MDIALAGVTKSGGTDGRFWKAFALAYVIAAVPAAIAVTFGHDPYRLQDARAFLLLPTLLIERGTYESTQILPLVPLLRVPIMWFFGTTNWLAIALFNCVFVALGVASTAGIAAHFRDNWFWPVAWLMAITPNVWVWGGILMAEATVLGLYAFSQYALFRAFRSRRVWLWLCLAGTSASLTFLSRPAMILVPVGFTVALVLLALTVRRDDPLRRRLAFVGVALGMFVATVLPWFAYNKIAYGTWAYSTQEGRATDYMYGCLMQSWGCGRADPAVRRRVFDLANEKLAALPEEERAKPFVISQKQKEAFWELMAEVPLVNIVRAAAGGFAKVLTHTSLSYLFSQYDVDHQTSIQGTLRKIISFEPALTDLAIFFGAVLNLLLRLLQLVGLVVMLASREWRWAVGGLAFLALSAIAPGTPLGNARYLVPAEPFFAILTAAGAYWLAQLWAIRRGVSR